MYEALKQEQRLCLIEGDIRDSATMQSLMLAVHTTPTGLTAETAQPLRNRVVEAFKPLRLGCCNDGKALINMRKLQPSPVDETFAKQSNFSGKCDISDTNAEIPQQRELENAWGETASHAPSFKEECVEFAGVETVFATAWDDLHKSR